MIRIIVVLILLPVVGFTQMAAQETNSKINSSMPPGWDRYQGYSQDALKLYETKQYRASAEKYTQAFQALGGKAVVTDRYNAACSWALAGVTDSAFYHLNLAATRGKYSEEQHLLSDADLKSLHADTRWQTIVQKVKQNYQAKNTPLDQELVARLNKLFMDDQSHRLKIDSIQKAFGADSRESKTIFKEMQKLDSLNVVYVRSLLDKDGWPPVSKIGMMGSQAIFLVLQHAPLKVQKQYLPTVQKAVRDGNLPASTVAMMEDRILVREGKRQVYGTQLHKEKDGPMYVQPLDDPENVDARRSAIGLPPMATYLASWNLTWDAKQYLKELPELEKRHTKNRPPEKE